MYIININNISLIEGCFISSDYWTDIILESGGSFDKKNQHIIFVCDEHEIEVYFNYYVDAEISTEDGDYYLPSSVDIIINNIDIDIYSINIDGIETEIDDIIHSYIMAQIKKELNL